MLTKTDLSQIRKIVREETGSAKDEVRSELKLARIRLETKLGDVEDKIKDIEIKVNNVEGAVAQMHKDLKKVKKDVSVIVNYFDKQDVKTQKRLDQLEERLQLLNPQ